MEGSNSVLIEHGPCSCGSSDAKATYSDGHSFCFSCGTYFHGDGTEAEPLESNLLRGHFQALKKRGITEESCRRWGYIVGKDGRKAFQAATYCDPVNRRPLAQKVRYAGKDFRVIGDLKKAGFFGQHLWREAGRKLVVVEGELDAISVSQVQNHKWPVVSVPNGAQGAKKTFQQQLEWLESFDEVVLMFDQDEPGRNAAATCAQLLSPGKAKIASLPLKDANEMLQAGRGSEIIDAIWSAKSYRPDGIVCGSELWEVVSTPEPEQDASYPWDFLNGPTLGLRRGELVTLCSGSGLGKSTVCREIAYHLIRSGESVGYIALEESVKRTAWGLMGLAAGRPLHQSRAGVSESDLRNSFDTTLGTGRVFLYDHFGSLEADSLLSRIRYLVRGCDCPWIVLDHLSIVVSGIDDGDERKAIDVIMTKLRSLVEETHCGMILVSHLKGVEGKGHEEGAKTSLNQLRGSRSIGQLSDIVVGLERNQQAEEDGERDKLAVRILKNRLTGITGPCGTLQYNHETGRLAELAFEEVFD